MKPRRTTIEPNKATAPTNNSYYRISISWMNVPGLNFESVNKIKRIFEELGLEQVETGSTSVEYKFKGTYEEYSLLKRAAMATLDALAGTQEFNITIHGRESNNIQNNI